MRGGWLVVVVFAVALAACNALDGFDHDHECTEVTGDPGLELIAYSIYPTAVGGLARFDFNDQCAPAPGNCCAPNGVDSVVSATASGPFTVTTGTAHPLLVQATGAGSGVLTVDVIEGGVRKTYTHALTAETADHVELAASCAFEATGTPLVLADERVSLSVVMKHGAQMLTAESFPLTLDGAPTDADHLVMPAAAGAVHVAAPSDPTAGLDLDVYTLDQLTKLEVTGDHTVLGVDLYAREAAYVGSTRVCTEPRSKMSATVGPTEICNLQRPADQTLSDAHLEIRRYTAGTCHVEIAIAGSTLVGVLDDVQ